MDDQQRVVATREGVEGDTITADVTYPVDASEGITGWYYDEACTKPVGELLTLGTSNVTLYSKVETGNWITFVSGEGATYQEPVFVLPNATTQMPAANPTRPGYTFRHWSAQDGGAAYTFGNTLEEDLTLYAVWQPEKVTYTVIHWWENALNDEYSYHESETLAGYTGQFTNATAKTYSVEGKDIQGNSTTRDDVFTAGEITQQTIAGDGSTIVNVYYERAEYTLTFKREKGTRICGKEEHEHD